LAYHNEKPERFTWNTEKFQSLIDAGILLHSYATSWQNSALAGFEWYIGNLELIEGEIVKNKRKHTGRVPRDDNGDVT
jgi:hypothetical protein